jgi:ferrochelatase
MKPYTVEVLKELPKKGIKKLQVACPAFVSDCLETLEEIAMQGKETFIQAGGESYETIPCLNTDPQWVALLADWIKKYGQGDETMILNK